MKYIALTLLIITTTHQSATSNNTCEANNQQHNQSTNQNNRPQIALVSIKDPIDIHKTAVQIIDVTMNTSIKGVLLVIDSRSGNVSYFSALHDLIKRLSLRKPTVCLIVEALSGGYLLASAADYIIAHSHSTVGAIGVINSWPKELTNEEHMTAGRYKDISWTLPSQWSKDKRDYVKTYLEKSYQLFLHLVVENRKRLALKNHTDWANGKQFFGREAIQLGLIDELGTFFEADSKLRALIQNICPEINANTLEYIQLQ